MANCSLKSSADYLTSIIIRIILSARSHPHARAEELLEGYERSLGCIARDRLMQKALDTITQNAQALASVPEAAPQAGAILRAVREIKE